MASSAKAQGRDHVIHDQLVLVVLARRFTLGSYDQQLTCLVRIATLPRAGK